MGDLLDYLESQNIDPDNGVAELSYKKKGFQPEQVQQPFFSEYNKTGNREILDIDLKSDFRPGLESIRNDLRAQAQSGTEKVLNSVGQMAGTFGTALLSSVAALGSGAVALGAEALSGGEAEGMDIFLNNPIMKGINDLDKYIKEDLIPTYYTKEQQESLFSASGGTDLLNGIGFMASAFVPNAAIGKLFGSWSKMAAIAKAGKLPAILAAAEKAGTLTNVESKLLSAFATHLDKAGPIVGAVTGRIGESAMEASQTYDQIKESLTAERDAARQEMELHGTPGNYAAHMTDEQIEEEAKNGRNNVFGGNMALAISDMAQFSRWFRGGGLGEKLIKDGFLTTVKNTGKKEIITELIKESAQEAGEEGFQFLLSKGAENAAKGAKTFTQGIEEASGDLFTTVEGQKSMLLGAILGGGMSSIAAAANTAKTKAALTQMANELTAAGDTSQRYITDPETGKRIVNPELSKVATTFAFYEQQKEKALEAGDKDAYDVAEKMQFSQLVAAKIKAGQFDEFVDELQNMGTVDAEEIKAMFGELPTKNGKEMSPAEVAFEKIQLAKRVKQMTEGFEKLPGMEKLGPGGMNIAKHMLFTQESLRDQLKTKDEKIAEIESRAVYNPLPVENSELFAEEDNLLPQDRAELQKVYKEKDVLLKEYKDISDVFKEIVATPEKAQEKADKIQEESIKNAVETESENLKKEGKDLANAVGQTIVSQNEDGTVNEIKVAEDEEGNFIDEETGEPLSKDFVLEHLAKPVEVEDNSEFTDNNYTKDDVSRQKGEDANEGYKKPTLNATSGQALTIEGGEYIVVDGENELNPEFINQTKLFNDPTISNDIVKEPGETPNTITFKAEKGTVSADQLKETNARRQSKGLAPLTEADFENSDYFPITLTLMVNGVAKNTVKSFYHDIDYYESTAEYERIQYNKELSDAAKEALHAKNIAMHKATRAKLVNSIKTNGAVVLATNGKSPGILNYNPKVTDENGVEVRKTNSVIGILAKNFEELLNGVKNAYYSVVNGKTNPINTKGIQIVTATERIPKSTSYIITVQTNTGQYKFVSEYEYGVGSMLFDFVAPNGDVVTTSPFTKNSLSVEQINALTDLIMLKLSGESIVNVDGKLYTIAGTESVPGILDSLLYVGAVKSKEADAIATQLFFTKDGQIQLGKKKYPADTENLAQIIKDHLNNYKSRPHFKFKSIEAFGNNFGIPVKKEDGTFEIKKSTTYMDFLFGGEKPLISTALNQTKFVNSYFNLVTDNGGKPINEVKTEVKVEETKPTEAKKADIEKRRQEELKEFDDFVKKEDGRRQKPLDEDFIKNTISKVNAKYDAELATLEGAKPKEQVESIEDKIDNIEKRRQEELNREFKGINLSQQSIDTISERSDAKAIAFIDKYDAINAKYDKEIEDLETKPEEQVEKPVSEVEQTENECKGSTDGKPAIDLKNAINNWKI